MNTLSEIISDPERGFDLLIKSIKGGLYCAMPAIVEDVNLTNQTLEAKPVTLTKTTNSSGVVSDFQLPILLDVPFCCYKGGGFSITVPVKKGDECLIIFTDMDFSAWFQNGGYNYSEHSFVHSYTNAVAIVGLSSEPNAIKDYNPEAIEIRNSDGSEKISMSAGNITLKSATIVLDGETTIQGKKFMQHVHTNGNQGGNTGGVV